jgi:hypothetical protein
MSSCMYEDSTYVDQIYQQHFLPEANKEQTNRPMARIPTNIITDNVNKNNGGYGGLQYSSELHQHHVLQGPRKNQPNRPIAKRLCDIAHSSTMYEHHYLAHRYGSQLHQQHPTLPRPGPIVPASTCDNNNTAHSARHSSDTITGQTVSSRLDLPAANTTQTSALPPGPVTLARSEQLQINAAPSQVRYSPRLRKLQTILAYEG